MENYKDHQSIIPYLILENAAAFIEFTHLVFNAKTLLIKYRDDERTVMHAEIKVGHTVLMIAEKTDEYEQSLGNFFIYVDDADETFNRSIYHGASVVIEIADLEYGRSGGVKDPFGNIWWLTTA